MAPSSRDIRMRRLLRSCERQAFSDLNSLDEDEVHLLLKYIATVKGMIAESKQEGAASVEPGRLDEWESELEIIDKRTRSLEELVVSFQRSQERAAAAAAEAAATEESHEPSEAQPAAELGHPKKATAAAAPTSPQRGPERRRGGGCGGEAGDAGEGACAGRGGVGFVGPGRGAAAKAGGVAAKAAGAGGGRSAEEMIAVHRGQHEALTDELLGFASTLKQQFLAMGSTVRSDSKVLDDMGTRLEGNTSKLTAENKCALPGRPPSDGGAVRGRRLVAHTRRTLSSTLLAWMLMALVCALFFAVYAVLRFGPARRR
eukprot:tig00020816_g14200.t1